MKSALAGILALAVVSPGASAQPTFRSGIDLVTFSVTVTDRKGNLVTDLTADDFEVYEDGRKQTINSFATGEGDPKIELHLGLLLDVSDSMGEDLAFTKTAAVK